ncbi:MAG TPA: hypothetical protein VIG88_13975 [Lysobacter sp.]
MDHTEGARERDFREFFGNRLREERERLRFNQLVFAQLMGVRRQAQASYEEGKTSPTAAYLHAAAERGVDVMYVLTGVPAPRVVREHAELVALFRSSPGPVQQGVMAMLRATAKAPLLEDDDILPADDPTRAFPQAGAPLVSRQVSVTGSAGIGQLVNGDQHVAGDQAIGAPPRKPRKPR